MRAPGMGRLRSRAGVLETEIDVQDRDRQDQQEASGQGEEHGRLSLDAAADAGPE